MKLLHYIIFVIGLSLAACHSHNKTFQISGDIEEPKNEIVESLVNLVNDHSNKPFTLEMMNDGTPSVDSLVSGKYDFMVVDNNIDYQEDVSVVIPLYPQILHILYKNTFQPTSLIDLLSQKKIYAGEIESGSYKLSKELIQDFHINKQDVEYLKVIDIFDADVILLFTDLISLDELIDLSEYNFFSLGEPSSVGSGTVAESISLRHPQFQPYILPSFIYGNKTKEAVLTISNEAVLVCNSNIDKHLIYELTQIIHDHKQVLYDISPLLYNAFDEDYNTQRLLFPLHDGARNFLARDEPSLIERYAGIIGIVITLLIALMSAIYTLLNYREFKKKDIIDKYYDKLINIRHKIPTIDTSVGIQRALTDVKLMQNETIELVIQEKLSANESYLVFMKLAEMINEELKEQHSEILNT